MKARLLTYWMTASGWNLSGKPDESEIEIPDGPHHAGDTFRAEDGTIRRVTGRHGGVVVIEERRVHVPMEVVA